MATTIGGSSVYNHMSQSVQPGDCWPMSRCSIYWPGVQRFRMRRVGNALSCLYNMSNTNIARKCFECIGDQQFVEFGALRGCVAAVKRFQIAGSRSCSFANMMRPPLFLHHAHLCTNPQHNLPVSPPPPHPSSRPPASAIWHPSCPTSATRTGPLA